MAGIVFNIGYYNNILVVKEANIQRITNNYRDLTIMHNQLREEYMAIYDRNKEFEHARAKYRY
jgi:hypothetical protein